MSMNLHLVATIEATSKVGKHTIRDPFDLFQTPTEATDEILSHEDVMTAYLAWGEKNCNFDYTLPVYAPEDIFQQKAPVGSEIHNAWKEHLQELAQWLEEHKGWDLEWYKM
jgi:hypothetical protein